jgi:NAD+ kinase
MVKKVKNKFSHISLSSSSKDKRVMPIATQVYEILNSASIRVSFDESLSGLQRITKEKHKSAKFIAKNSDLVVAIGGDGTMLNCSRKFGSCGVPILGINLGKVGFLTDIAPEEVTLRLLDVIKGNFIEDKRFFLEASIEGVKKKFTALNEVVIHSGAIAQLIEFDLYVDDCFVYRQKADGLIVNSPTGSTAYSLSGGGPILHPNLDVITLLPMFPQSLSTSPLIVSAKSEIRVELIDKRLRSQLSFDSQDSINLKGLSKIIIAKSESVLSLIHPEDHDFFEGCRNKLGWSSGLENKAK